MHLERCISIPGEPQPRFSFWIGSECHAMLVHGSLPDNARVGDLVRITGEMHLDFDQYRYATAHTATFATHAKIPAPAFRPLGPSDLANPALNDRFVELSGTVTEAFTDEIDPQYTYFELYIGGETLHAAINNAMIRAEKIRAIVGAVVRITGVYNMRAGSLRRYMGPMLRIFNQDDIAVVNPAPSDPRDFPECPSVPFLSPREIRSWGKRRMSGEVMATWQGNQLLLKTADGNMHRIELAHGCPLPKPGDRVTVGGQCQTDFYHVNLTRAICRTEERAASVVQASPNAAHLFVKCRGIIFAVIPEFGEEECDARRFEAIGIGRLVQGGAAEKPDGIVRYALVEPMLGHFPFTEHRDALGQLPQVLRQFQDHAPDHIAYPTFKLFGYRHALSL